MLNRKWLESQWPHNYQFQLALANKKIIIYFSYVDAKLIWKEFPKMSNCFKGHWCVPSKIKPISTAELKNLHWGYNKQESTFPRKMSAMLQLIIWFMSQRKGRCQWPLISFLRAIFYGSMKSNLPNLWF